MEKRILFISEKKSMIANALIDGLTLGAFQVMQVKANVTEISRAAGDPSDMPEIWILFMQGTETRLTEVLSYIRDQVEEHNVRFFAIGSKDEIEETLKDFPPGDLKGSFTRPFRTDEVVDRMAMEAMKVQRLSESKRILIVDDDATMLRTMKDMLSGRYRVYTANSGMNAIQMLVNTEVDLVLLDYEMPVIKGPQILEMIRSETHTKDIPVMFLTSKNDRESIIQVMSLNPVNYLLKSLPQSEILSKIEEYFEQEAKRG
ncbi:MAG: response regulator [Lachnospiraceae bacterium]|nr:response regulator [Lachnospiraceae bacterium]